MLFRRTSPGGGLRHEAKVRVEVVGDAGKKRLNVLLPSTQLGDHIRAQLGCSTRFVCQRHGAAVLDGVLALNDRSEHAVAVACGREQTGQGNADTSLGGNVNLRTVVLGRIQG